MVVNVLIQGGHLLRKCEHPLPSAHLMGEHIKDGQNI